MIRRQKMAVTLGSLATTLVICLGCASTATPPQPMTGSELKAALDKASPQDQIDWVNRSPMPPNEKEARIKEIRTKYNLPDPNAGSH